MRPLTLLHASAPADSPSRARTHSRTHQPSSGRSSRRRTRPWERAGLLNDRHPGSQLTGCQYFGPMCSSINVTEALWATEMFQAFACFHSTLTWSRASVKMFLMSADLLVKK
jgi:hypothetical protein